MDLHKTETYLQVMKLYGKGNNSGILFEPISHQQTNLVVFSKEACDSIRTRLPMKKINHTVHKNSALNIFKNVINMFTNYLCNSLELLECNCTKTYIETLFIPIELQLSSLVLLNTGFQHASQRTAALLGSEVSDACVQMHYYSITLQVATRASVGDWASTARASKRDRYRQRSTDSAHQDEVYALSRLLKIHVCPHTCLAGS